jgi:hypothetical protein
MNCCFACCERLETFRSSLTAQSAIAERLDAPPVHDMCNSRGRRCRGSSNKEMDHDDQGAEGQAFYGGAQQKFKDVMSTKPLTPMDVSLVNISHRPSVPPSVREGETQTEAGKL